ncbi:ubiquinone biosynthesis protein COQ4 [Sphingomonas lacunae]|uniref:ubiquinone biosynthesis protein COQ4 n=1 Tax=Sphingomonas lacunae TaxID=2698828 RepID=UPI001FE5CA05|nr:ubiquinone biosynthesis protein COQ4 [Sphingomonas lacunae]
MTTPPAVPAIFADPSRKPLKFRPFKALGHFRELIKDKEDTEQVFHIFESLPRKSFLPEAQAFCESEQGQRLMREEFYLPDVLDDHETLRRTPLGSVAHAYCDFMEQEGLSAAGLVAESAKMGRPVFDDQLQWYANRLRDTHDMLHVLTGYGRDALGEQCVLAFTWGQNRNLGNIFIAYAGGLELKRSVKADAPIFAALKEGRLNGRAALKIHHQSILDLLKEPLSAARQRLGIGDPAQYHACHRAYTSRGIDPYNFLAAPAAA